jgi:hypothetical protein
VYQQNPPSHPLAPLLDRLPRKRELLCFCRRVLVGKGGDLGWPRAFVDSISLVARMRDGATVHTTLCVDSIYQLHHIGGESRLRHTHTMGIPTPNHRGAHTQPPPPRVLTRPPPPAAGCCVPHAPTLLNIHSHIHSPIRAHAQMRPLHAKATERLLPEVYLLYSSVGRVFSEHQAVLTVFHPTPWGRVCKTRGIICEVGVR